VRSQRPSLSAQYVAIVRCELTRMGVIDDPLAATMLRRPMKFMAAALRYPPVRRVIRSPLYAGLAARTMFFDDQVVRALDAGIDQVVIVAAGYDSRAWRLGRPAVRFIELDHPATQADKQRRAPAGGPAYAPCDLTVDRPSDALVRAGWDSARPTIFTVEGLTMYLKEDDVHSLLSQLAKHASPGSRLAVNFAPPSVPNGRLLRILARAGREPFRFSISPDAAGPFVTGCGWELVEVSGLRDVGQRLADHDGLPMDAISRDATTVTGALTG
jgi:methyltransferase (TIGR00027 family)